MNNSELPVLLVDDDKYLLQSSSLLLRSAGIENVLAIDDSREVMPFLFRQEAAVIVLDLVMPHIAGTDLLMDINSHMPQTPVIVMTASDDIATAVNCTKAGAFDYLVKPVEKERFLSSVRSALEMGRLRNEVSLLKRYLLGGDLAHEHAFSSIITNSNAMKAVFRYIEAISASRQPVLITGETGVGKELVAKAVHDLSGCKGAFVAVNIAGLDDMIFSDTLFGHKKGAFTGADQAREGLIVQASGGTLFLDEIGDLSESSQVKMLRLLQEGTYYPMGSDTYRKSDARIVVATNHELRKLLATGKFRKDLYYRLFSHHIYIPSLRERPEDIPLLFLHFLDEATQHMGKKRPTVSPRLITLLSAYHFPGNVRELRAMVFDAVTRHSSGMLTLESFKEIISHEHSNLCDGDAGMMQAQAPAQTPDGMAYGISGRFPTLKEAEEHLIAEALKMANGNQGIAASFLGITRQALNKRLTRKNDKNLPEQKERL
jgi:DNA-binding NtrC family response regulator